MQGCVKIHVRISVAYVIHNSWVGMYLLEYNNKLVRKQGREKVKYVETGGIRADWAALSTTTMGHSVKLTAFLSKFKILRYKFFSTVVGQF